MNGIEAVAGVALLMTFLFGVILGIVVIASYAINREDKRSSLKGTPPDSACSGTRWLVGVGRRDYRPGQAPYFPGEHPGPGHEAPCEEPDDRDDHPWWPSQR